MKKFKHSTGYSNITVFKNDRLRIVVRVEEEEKESEIILSQSDAEKLAEFIKSQIVTITLG